MGIYKAVASLVERPRVCGYEANNNAAVASLVGKTKANSLFTNLKFENRCFD